MTFSDAGFRRDLQMHGAGGDLPPPRRTATGGPEPAACSFCGRTSPDTGVVFTGPGGLIICEHCVEHAYAQLPEVGRREPAEATRARAEIAEAFARMGEPGGVLDEDLPFVEAGTGLAPYLQQAGQGYEGRASLFVVDSVEFIAATQAKVRFRITGFMEMGFQGHATVEDGRWKVARETLAGLLSRAGVLIPPRAA
jgi:hypothetical protein